MHSALKFNSRSKIYSASNVFFNSETCQAYSFVWWRFVEVINGRVVFNRHCYSSYTSRHQSKVRSLLHDLGITIDLEVDARVGLQNDNWVTNAINTQNDKIKDIEAKLSSPKHKRALDNERFESIESLKQNIVAIQALGV